ncbi:hypothetical protein [Sandaracinobacteroides hominis]|uniref:hypothetical protein n=1 Tax=Sandaracinobacteroides hominis TaxID=2780086 RepID=UPI0018F68F92|nr:hypothetical protein [Sandaracinobacteroides hominis]
MSEEEGEVTSTPDRSLIENAFPLPWDRASKAAGWPAALDELTGQIEASQGRQRALRSADRERLRETLGSMLLGLYALRRADKGRWGYYSRDNNSYGPSEAYAHALVTAHTARTVADWLVAQGLAEQVDGFLDRRVKTFGKGRGKQPRIKATAALQRLLEGRGGVRPENLGHADWTPLIRLKGPAESRGGSKPLLDYPPTDATRRMEREVRELNTFLNSFRVELAPAGRKGLGKSKGLSAVADPVRLYRVFNNACWTHVGRFYGGWWQELPKAKRRHLLIDGEAVIELDFRALHPRLCYQMSGQPLGPMDDPYAFPGMKGVAQRNLVKTALNQLINITPGMHLKTPAGAAKALPQGLSFKELLAQIELAHAPIGNWFRSAREVELQHIDSVIAETILRHFRKAGICCLPVHDSFIVPRSAERLLGWAMLLTYSVALERLGRPGPYPVLAGWSSPKVEAEVMDGLPPP